MNQLLSVIIPVYKVEKYLEECVNSVLAQDYDRLEIILVDDGSPDKCPEMCDRLACEDKRIKVIHKENGGLSSARNAGLKAASGAYVAFLDSDDKWNPQVSLKQMMGGIEDNADFDFLMFDSINFVDRSGERYSRKDSDGLKELMVLKDFPEQYRQMVTMGNIREAAYTKLLKRSFLVENVLFFQEGLLGEDTEWSFRVYRKHPRISVCCEPLVMYRFGREGSITTAFGKKNMKDIVKVIDQSIRYYRNSVAAEDYSVKISELGHCACLWCVASSILPDLNTEDRKEMTAVLKKYSHILKYSLGKKTRLTRVVYHLTGMSITGKLLHLYSSKIRLKLNLKKV